MRQYSAAVQQGRSTPLIDAHAHLFLVGLPQVRGSTAHVIEEDFTAEDYLKILDEHGIHYGVIAAPSGLSTFNDYTIRMLRKYKRLRGTVIVRPDVDFYILEQMNRDGVIGIRLALWGYPDLPDLTTPDWQRTLRRVRDLEWHVHMNLEAPRMPQVLPALEKAGVKLILDHFARPDPQKGMKCEGFQAALRAVGNGRTWVKLSAPYRLRTTPENVRAYAAEWLKNAGPERLLWASDCPFSSYEKTVTYPQTLDWLEEWVPDPALRYRIHTETPAALYGLA